MNPIDAAFDERDKLRQQVRTLRKRNRYQRSVIRYLQMSHQQQQEITSSLLDEVLAKNQKRNAEK